MRGKLEGVVRVQDVWSFETAPPSGGSPLHHSLKQFNPMGLLDFLKDKGKDIFGGGGNESEDIKKEVERALGSNVSNLTVHFNDGKVTLMGDAKSQAAKEKAALIAGNVKGVSNVNDDGLKVAGGAAASAGATRYYTIQSGDSLSKIAKEMYGDSGDYNKIFEANREVIEDPDKIYPGQQIRIPA